jgi:kynurenine formamidase
MDKRVIAEIDGKTFDLNQPVDISIPFGSNLGPLAWYLDRATIEPVKMEGFVGAVREGGSVNFNNILFNPHGHCTHTECVGHITEKEVVLYHHFNGEMKMAQLISVKPNIIKEDNVITLDAIGAIDFHPEATALIIRTLPNSDDKKNTNYSNTNPTYFDPKVIQHFNSIGIEHLIVDLPSVDREEDGGALISHKTFWEYPANTQYQKTITELAYIPDNVLDGLYLLQIQFIRVENDASPSRPLLFPEIKT